MTEKTGKNIFQRNLFFALCALLCLPLFTINVKDSHDWGDDFAQYILQAKNIVEGKPQTETGYVYDKALPVVAPPAYPAGFPLMLAMVYAVKGNSVKAFNYLITALLFLLCLCMFWFYRKYCSELSALLLVLIFAYNPWTLSFKTEILSDIPFALFLLLATLLYLQARNSVIYFLLTGIACGVLLSIRGVAAIFILALLLHSVYLFFKEKKTAGQTVFKKPLIIFGSALVVYVLMNMIFVKIPTGSFLEFYSHAYEKSTVGSIVIQNLNYYTEVFEAYFDPHPESWNFIATIFKSFSLALLLTGMLHCLLHRRSFIDLFVWMYILLFIVYPYSAGGFRFILPVFPFLLYYMVAGLRQVKINIPANRNALILAGAFFVLLSYRHSILEAMKDQPRIVQGPQEPQSVEAFNYISQNVNEEAVIVFKKPKALALYTGRKTASTVYYQSAGDVKNMLNGLHAEYVLLNKDGDPELGDEPLKKYTEEFAVELQLCWENNKFLLYQRIEGVSLPAGKAQKN